jgi:ribulose-phosphate 3-epimerase
MTRNISPSILSADFTNIREQIHAVADAGATRLHIDVMDGHFVPNLTIGPPVIKALRKQCSIKFDVHLMISPVHKYIEAYANAGADIITRHPEATENLGESISKIKSLNKKVGVSLNPESKIDLIANCLEKIDLVLIMSVNPGFGGQSCIPSSLEKLRVVRKMIDDRNLSTRLEIDGGVKTNNIREIASAGADTFVAGSAIFNTENYKSTIDEMRSELALAV